MKWYVAHAILYFKFKDGAQENFPIWENLYLVRADSHEKASAVAAELGNAACDASECEWEGRRAALTFVGIRKTVECDDTEPTHGTEVSYTEMSVKSLQALHALAHVGLVDVTLEEADGENGTDGENGMSPIVQQQ